MKSLILYKQLEEVSFSLTKYDEKGKNYDIFSGLNEKEEVNISIVATSLNIDSLIGWSYEHGKSKHYFKIWSKIIRFGILNKAKLKLYVTQIPTSIQ